MYRRKKGAFSFTDFFFLASNHSLLTTFHAPLSFCLLVLPNIKGLFLARSAEMLSTQIDVEVCAIHCLEPTSQEINPYVLLKLVNVGCGGGGDCVMDTKRSPCVPRSSDPVWKESAASFAFLSTMDLSQIAIKVEVWSESTNMSSDEFVGETKLSCGSELNFGFPRDQWLPLKNARGSPTIHIKWKVVDASGSSSQNCLAHFFLPVKEESNRL